MDAAVMTELEGLRALARSLVHGDAEADDLVQDVAEAALRHPPATDRPVGAWLRTVLRNRRRLGFRRRVRREAREAEHAPEAAADAGSALDRARVLEKLSAALVALPEPFRTAVVRRYLDGESCAQLARTLGVPAATVRWRLREGLARLRAALDDGAHSRARWMAALGGLSTKHLVGGLVLVKTKVAIVGAILVLLALLVGGIAYWKTGDGESSTNTSTSTSTNANTRVSVGRKPEAGSRKPEADPDPLPGQGKATMVTGAFGGGALHGRVINWSTGAGVDGAALTFMSDQGASEIRSGANGEFALAPDKPGTFTLAAVAAPEFLPYAPELAHSTIRVQLARDRDVRGVTVFLFPAVAYHGRVVDAAGKPVAGAAVKLLGTPAGEQRPATAGGIATAWVSDKDGAFEFNAADFAVLEAIAGKRVGRALLDGNAALTHSLVIALADLAPSDRRITGRVVDEAGAPVGEALVTAQPTHAGLTPQQIDPNEAPRATLFALATADGVFTIDSADRDKYSLFATADERAPGGRTIAAGGETGVTLVVDRGEPIAGHVKTTAGDPVPAFTLVAFKRDHASREEVVARSIVDAAGAFSIRVPAGDYELVASASGWAPSPPTRVHSSTTDVALVVTQGATLRGTVVAAEDGKTPIPYARITREGLGGGASAAPANAGTVTRDDGTFELTGIPAGPVAITIGAGERNPKIEAGLTAHDGDTLGPITIPLTIVKPGEKPQIELVGIGVKLVADDIGLRVDMVVPGGGAAAAGIVVGDHIVTVEGQPVADLGMDGAIAQIRGVEGTTVNVAVRRGEQVTALVVERRKLKT